MKQLYIVFLLVLSSFLFSVDAQQDQRTLDTKVADIVMLMPARDTQTLNQLMGELNQLGDVVPYMASMLSDPGKGDDSKIRYAIAGLSFYVSQSGKEKDRQAVATGLCKAIEKTSSEEIKDFLLIQLQYVAGEESVETVGKYLSNSRLCDPAVRVLVRINSESSKKLLLDTLKKSSNDTFRISLIGGLGDLSYTPAASPLEKMIQTNNPRLKSIVLDALAEITAPSSQKALEKAAQQVGFVYESTNALGAYVLYLTRMLDQDGGTKMVSKASKDLLKKTESPQMIAAHCAALSLYALSEKENAISELIKALDSSNKTVRGTALAASLDINTPAMTKALLDKAGVENNFEIKSEIIYALGTKGDKSALSFIESNINAGNAFVKNASIVALGKLNGENDFGKIIQVMNVNDDQIIATAKQTLLTVSNPQMITPVASAIPQVNPSAQIALIEILSERNAKNAAEAVFVQANSSNPDVKLAAEQALKNLTEEKDLARLSSLLGNASGEKDILALQEAIYSAVAINVNKDKQTELIIDQLKSSSKPELYYNVLAMVGGKKGLDIVKDAFDKGSANVKDQAFKALASWSDFSTAPTLFTIAQSNPSGTYFDKALTSFVGKINPSDNSPEQKSRYFIQALEIAKTDAQKDAIIGELSKTATFSALNTAGTYLDSKNSNLQQSSVQTIFKIVLSNNEVNGETVKPLIEKAIAVNKDPEAEYQKQAVLKQIAAWPKEGGAVVYTLPSDEVKQNFVPMFNGIDMNGWIGNLKDYGAKDGMIVCDPKYGGRGNLYTEKEYSDFIMRFDFLLTAAANNGLGIRTPLEGDAAYVGMELQILDNTAEVYKNLKEYQYHGSVYGIIPSKKGALNPVGEWNTQEVEVKGNRIKITLNGVIILDGDIAKASKNFTVMPDGREHPGLSNKKGHIGFLGHGSYVSFKNLRIKDLSGDK